MSTFTERPSHLGLISELELHLDSIEMRYLNEIIFCLPHVFKDPILKMVILLLCK